METVLSSILKMKDVERFNGTRKLQGYNLLEHSYMTAMLFRIFASKEDVAYDINVLTMCFAMIFRKQLQGIVFIL